MTESLFWLTITVLMTALFWLPYTLELIGRIGLLPALSLAEADERKVNATPGWAERMKKAHYNAIENLVVFSTLVLIGHSIGIPVVLAAQVYFFARLAHFVFYTLNIGVLRTLSFFGGFFAQAYAGLLILEVI